MKNAQDTLKQIVFLQLSARIMWSKQTFRAMIQSHGMEQASQEKRLQHDEGDKHKTIKNYKGIVLWPGKKTLTLEYNPNLQVHALSIRLQSIL